MSYYTKLHLQDVNDLAANFGMTEKGEAHFARDALGAERIGLAYYRLNAGRRVGFGHSRAEIEETYVAVAGSGRFKVDDEVFPIAVTDVVYCQPSAMREWEAGPDGLELLAFGEHAGNDAEMKPGRWTD